MYSKWSQISIFVAFSCRFSCFLKENTPLQNGKSKEELLRNTEQLRQREMTAKKLCFEYKVLFYPSNERADISKHYSGHELSAKFSSTSGNSTAKKGKV